MHQLKSLSEIDRTDSKLIKIVALPYFPDTLAKRGDYYICANDKWRYNAVLGDVLQGTLTYQEPNATNIGTIPNFIRNNINYLPQITSNMSLTISAPTVEDSARYNTESKLYNSQFFTSKLVFDKDNLEIPHENLVDRAIPPSISYKTSGMFSNSFAFGLNVLKEAEVDFADLMVVNTANNIPLYSSAYLDYMRAGYGYDVEANKIQKKQMIANTVVNLSSSAATGLERGLMSGNLATAAVGAGVGLAEGAIKSAININQLEENQNFALKSKMGQLLWQKTNISDVSDYDIMRWYSNNRLHYMEYKPNEATRNRLYNYFRFYGYSKNVYDTPNVDSRCWYNYIQCEPHIPSATTERRDWLEMLKAKYREGITVFHHNVIDDAKYWDFDRKYENWETWILGGNN